MKRLTLYIALIWVSFVALQSCYKDKGNYTYTELDKVLIDTSNLGIQATYSLDRYDTLTIAPKLFINNQEITDFESIKIQYSFTWSIYQAVTGGTVYSRDTLSHDFILRAPISKPAGTWNLVLSVKNNQTLVEAYQKFSVEVNEAISDGWAVLYEKDGRTDVGLIIDERSKLGATKTNIFTDLIKSSNGESLEGKPISFLHSATPLNSREVLVASQKDLQAYNHTDFASLFQFHNLFYSVPSVRNIQALSTNNNRKELIINNNEVHVANFTLGNALDRTVYFGPSLLGNNGELASWLPTFIAQSYDAVVYDASNKKFLYSVSNSMRLTELPEQLPTAEWDPNNLGLDLVASDYGFPNTPLANEYLIMKNASETYLLTANFASPVANAIAQKKYNMSTLPQVSNISAMAASSTGAYILYGAENNLYTFRYQINEVENVWSAPAGEKITCVKFLKFYHTAVGAVKLTPLGVNEYIYVATYNESTKEGKVYNLKINITNGVVDKTSQKQYTGFGRITDMGYKWNL